MIIKVSKILVLFASISLLLSCASTKTEQQRELSPEKAISPRPQWVLTGSHPSYPNPRYVIGVGLAKEGMDPVASRRQADANAFSEIAHQVLAHISSDVSVLHSEILQDRVLTMLEKTIADTRIQTSLTISGLIIVGRFFDPNAKILYSLGVLDRQAASETYKAKLLQFHSDYRQNELETEKYLIEGRLMEALVSLRETLFASFHYQEMLPAYQLLAGVDFSAETQTIVLPSPMKALNKLSDVLSKLRLKAADGNNQQFIIGKVLKTALTVQVLLIGQKEIALQNVPVVFSFVAGKGILLGSGRTNSDGMASSTVQKIDRVPGRSYTVSAKVDLKELADTSLYSAEWNKRLLSATTEQVVFQFMRKTVSVPMKVLVLVEQSSQPSGRALLAREAISQELSEVGFSPVTENEIGLANARAFRSALQKSKFERPRNVSPESVDIVLIGEIAADALSNVQGLKVYAAKGMVKAVSLRTGHVLGVESFKDVRGFGNTDEQAAENAIRAAAERIADTVIAEILTIF